VRTIGTISDRMTGEILTYFRDLAECPPVAAFTTLTQEGYPQTSVVWCDFDGHCMRVNTMRGFAKERNMRRDPRVTLLCYDPRRPLRYLEVRGTVVEMTEAGAAEHLDSLASKYAGRPVRFFGDAIPASFAETETPVLCRIRPARVAALDVTGPAPCDGTEWKHMTGAIALETASIPSSHVDLLTRPAWGVFTTLGQDGQPRSAVVWVDLDRGCALANPALERRKGRHLPGDPKVSLLVVDPGNTSRFIQIRGDAELVTEDETHEPRETRVICRLHPRRVTLDAIHIADHESGRLGRVRG
jgi:PPOX class probable F420-dependent enzyme